MGKKKERNSKPLPVNYSVLSMEDFEMFGGIEELGDYTVVKAGSKRIRGNINHGKVRKKKPSRKVCKQLKTDMCSLPEMKTETEKLDMSAWCNLFVPDKVLASLQELGFEKPTKIQELALPPSIRDHLDILAAAETGSGKTLAFGIPMISHIMAAKERECTENRVENNLKGLILTPTRELAMQIKNHLHAITKYVDIKIITIVGGMSQEKQRRLLQKSPDIIVATPGRLWQLMEEDEPHLKQVPFVRYLVIDEADRMVEKGHFEELSKILEQMNENKQNKRRQNFVYSATLTMVHDIPKRLELNSKKGKIIRKNKLESLMELIGIKDKPKIIDITKTTVLVDTLTESQICCSLEEKDTYLYYFIVMYPGRTLVFCNSISSVRRLKSVFEHLGCHPLTLHASMHQKQRLKNLETFASSENGLLLATDVAARGLDIRGIEHVVHFQVPRTVEVYVHRSGRTARAQNEGLSLMLVEPQEAVCYKRICKTLNKNHALPVFPVDQAVLKIVKERVSLARLIDQQEHREQRLAAQNRWLLKVAEDMDVEMDEKELLNELGSEQERALKSKKLNILKKQLKSNLKKPLLPKKFTGSYPTKSGKLLLPSYSGKEKAYHVMKDPSKVASYLKTKKKKQKYLNPS